MPQVSEFSWFLISFKFIALFVFLILSINFLFSFSNSFSKNLIQFSFNLIF